MAQIIWDPVAIDDLDEVGRYIARSAPAAARRLVQRIIDRVEKLKRFPLTGGFISEDNRRIYRQLIQGNYRIICRSEGDDVFIVAVYHAARLLPASQSPSLAATMHVALAE
jgi:addiction module RelE/StbE family toxin